MAKSKVQGTHPSSRVKTTSARQNRVAGLKVDETTLSHPEEAALGVLELEEAHLVNHRILRQKARKTKVTNKTARCPKPRSRPLRGCEGSWPRQPSKRPEWQLPSPWTT